MARHQTDRAAEIDRHVGARIRERRVLLGLTQQQLADLIGVTCQQAHKYVRGINRVSAGCLFQIAEVLGVPIDYFYEGAGSGAPAHRPLHARARLTLDLARAFGAIADPRLQEALSVLTRSLAGPPERPDAA